MSKACHLKVSNKNTSQIDCHADELYSYQLVKLADDKVAI